MRKPGMFHVKHSRFLGKKINESKFSRQNQADEFCGDPTSDASLIWERARETD